MSDISNPTHGADDEGARLTMSPNAPLRPETGSPLDMLLRRQGLGSGGRALLRFVPAQVR